MQKRILSLLLAAWMLIPLAACTKSEKPDADTGKANPKTSDSDSADSEAETEPVDTGIADSLETVNFDGEPYVIFGTDRTTGMVTAETLDDDSTMIQQAQYKAREAVQERFNCKISYVEPGGDDEAYALFQSLHSSGDTSYAVGFARDSLMISVMTSGLSMNLTNVSQFDFDAPWWTNSTEVLAIGDQRRIASSFLSYTCLYYARMVVINKGMAADLNLEIPYEKVFAGEWYLDDMIALASSASSDLNGDGIWDGDDRYGWANARDLLYTFQSSLGINFIIKDENNNPMYNNCVDRAEVYLQKMTSLLDNHVMYTDNAGYGNGMLANGGTLMCYCNLREVCNDPLYSSDIVYGFLPAPKLDETQEDYITSATDVFWAIPLITTSRADFIGTITEALQCQHYNLVRPAFFETTMKIRLSDAPEDAQVLDIIPRTLTIDLDYVHGVNMNSLFYTSSLTKLASQAKRAEGAIMKKVDNLITRTQNLP